MRKEVRIGQVPQTRAVIRHPVRFARDKEAPRLVTVRALVHRLKAKQVEAGPVEDTASLVDQECAGVLSVPVAVVSSARSVSCARTMLCPIVPASLRSELVMDPRGLSHDTSCEETSSGNGNRHSVGGRAEGLSRAAAVPSALGSSSGMVGSPRRLRR